MPALSVVVEPVVALGPVTAKDTLMLAIGVPVRLTSDTRKGCVVPVTFGPATLGLRVSVAPSSGPGPGGGGSGGGGGVAWQSVLPRYRAEILLPRASW